MHGCVKRDWYVFFLFLCYIFQWKIFCFFFAANWIRYHSIVISINMNGRNILSSIHLHNFLLKFWLVFFVILYTEPFFVLFFQTWISITNTIQLFLQSSISKKSLNKKKHEMSVLVNIQGAGKSLFKWIQWFSCKVRQALIVT